MKKALIFVFCLVFLIAVPGQAKATMDVHAKFTVGATSYWQEDKYYNMDVAPFIENGRVYVPVRYLAYALGMTDNNVAWLPSFQTVTFRYASKDVSLQVANKDMLINTTDIQMDAAPVIRNGRVFLPARYVAEAFGANVHWDSGMQAVFLSWDDGVPNNQAQTVSSSPETVPPYIWTYKGDTWTWDPKYKKAPTDQFLAECKTIPHPIYTDADYMKVYCTVDDKGVLRDIATHIKNGAVKNGYDDAEIVGLVIAFVQSFAYTSDSVSAGFDEYPRYPMETLLAREGDCEDTAILTACLIHELGYGTALIIFKDHCAVGVACDDSWSGSYYEINGRRYYYLETTDKGWGIGEVPDKYLGMDAKAFPLP